MDTIPDQEGYVYLLHFERPIAPGHTCQHYLGYAKSVATRLQEHATGHGARLTQVARQRGIGWRVARLWRGSRWLERRLKARKETPLLCPICSQHPYPVGYADEVPVGEIEEYLLPF